MGVHREALYRRLRKLRTDAETARRRQGEAEGLQKALQKQVRLTRLPETSSFEGKVASRWAPARLEDFSVPRPGSFEQVLAVVAVWESWVGAGTLQDDGRVRPAWLAGEGCKDWRRVLEAAHEETMRARRRVPEASGKEAEVDAAVARYRERLVQSYGRLNLDVLGPDGRAGEQPAIRLRQVFEVPLASWDPPRPELPARVWRELVERGEVQEDDLPESDLPATPDARQAALRRAAQARQPPLPVLEAVASERGRRLVLLGDPGAGKSTLARFLALALADGLEQVPDALQDLAAAGAVPVVVELRHLADEERWRGRTVEDFWEEFNTTERMCLPRGVLQYLLEHAHRPVVMIFDGLDEIFAPARRAEVARQIAAFAQTYEHVRVILTSRGIGFHAGVFTNAGFSQAKLDDLSHQQIETFIRRWYHAAHPDDPSEASRLTERLINAVRGFPSVAELAGNPLLLTILASIGLGATIPRERREVYRHAVDVLTGRWDRDAKHLELPRQDHPDVAAAIEELDGRLLQELLERIARRLQEGAGDGQTGTLISRTELSGLIADYVIEMGYPSHVARIVANAMVNRLHERAFLLHPHGAGMYGFVHRTFLEYLAARDLSERYTAGDPSLHPLVDFLAERSADPTWHEVILLLLGQISRQAEAEHAAFIHRLLEMHQKGRTDYFQVEDHSKYLELAIRALAEAHRIGRTPSRPVQHPHQSLALQSNAAIDTLIAYLTNTFFPELDDALPALASFPYSWTGRERFHRWYKAEIARPDRWGNSGKVAVWMCRNLPEAIQLARIPWASETGITLRMLGERWSDREEIRTMALSIARDTATPDNTRADALRTLGEYWSDHKDSRPTILDAARDTTTPDNVRATALQTLATRLPYHEETHTILLSAARDTTTPDNVRATALQTLAARWPDHEETHTTILSAARDTTIPENVRATALQTLATRWPYHEETHTTILDAARNTTTPENTRTVALQTLAARWPDHEETHTTILDAARDTTSPNDVRATALRMVARWVDHEDARTTILDAARDTTSPNDVRAVALQTLATRWPDHEETHTTILDAARNTTSPNDVRTAALQTLATRWPYHEETHTTILSAARNTTTPDNVRAVALQTLATRWPDHEETHTTILDAARNTSTGSSRAAALRTLARQWPGHEETHTTILDAARDTTSPNDVRAVALQTLATRWPYHEETHTTILDAARNTTSPNDVRATALQTLATRWPDHEETHTTILSAARNATTPDNVRAVALQTLATRWPDQDFWDCAASCVQGPEESLRGIAIRLLALVWPQTDETAALLASAAEGDVSAEVRATAAQAVAYIEAVAEINANAVPTGEPGSRTT